MVPDVFIYLHVFKRGRWSYLIFVKFQSLLLCSSDFLKFTFNTSLLENNPLHQA